MRMADQQILLNFLNLNQYIKVVNISQCLVFHFKNTAPVPGADCAAERLLFTAGDMSLKPDSALWEYENKRRQTGKRILSLLSSNYHFMEKRLQTIYLICFFFFCGLWAEFGTVYWSIKNEKTNPFLFLLFIHSRIIFELRYKCWDSFKS